ncbi:hypothetical protein [Subtercola boreus]|uniref:Uncharacterized protein n=1 Tax=Subtercola boreus TaxID=120213 RepID=A0A3E0WAS3_9MICO|nr:hypothetical protein [Subtercola boreus]RFA20305.1 hypothetical protein B7R24_09895 [Subtercola boreus]RFA20458.1 hypothetical protein B7R23_09830 [Subtercola boreus]RFA26708.1 hypothetical protein B7R25_09960 [Subtercola boreus]
MSGDDDHATGLLTRLVRARTLGPEALESLRRDVASDSRIGIGYLGVGAIVAAILLSVRGLAIFIFNWGAYDNPWLTLIAWIAVAIAIGGGCLIANAHGSQLPTPAYAGVLILLAGAVILDLVSAHGFVAASPEVTVIVGAGATLLSLVAFRPLNELILATIVLFVFLFVVTLVGAGEQAIGDRPQIEVIVAAMSPPLIAILIVKSFSRFIDRELDRTLVESTLSSPRFAVGILGSDELARLDQSAEELLSDVASGRISLPLDPTQAAAASSLASELRLRLIAGRRQTWLQHAIDDSEVLSPTVSLVDPDGLAGYLEPDQREGLLSAIWLIAASATRQTPSIVITVGPQDDPDQGGIPDMMNFPIEISIDGIPRRRIDVTIWGALDRVGQHSESGRHGSIDIRVNAQVQTPES